MRLIDADKMVADIKYQNDILQAMGLGDYADVLAKGFLQEIDNQPTVDAVPVVRCKDCKWGREVCGNIECRVDLNVPAEYHGYDWFCPNGKRKMDGGKNNEHQSKT